MAIHDKNGLLNRMLQLIRSAGINGKTTAQNVRDFITDLIDTMFSLAGSGSASGSTDFEWDPEEEYNTTDNKFAISRLRIFKSKVDGNIGNEPPYITDEFGNYEDDFWVEVSAAPKSGIIPYAPGVFLDSDELAIVYHNSSLYLLAAERPFESVDIDAEIANDDWIDLTGGGSGGGTGVFEPVQDITALKAIDTTSAEDFPDKWAILVEDEGAWYRLDRDSAVSEGLPYIVEPNTGPGRWIQDQHLQLDGKADKATGHTPGNLSELDADGNPVDSGVSATPIDIYNVPQDVKDHLVNDDNWTGDTIIISAYTDNGKKGQRYTSFITGYTYECVEDVGVWARYPLNLRTVNILTMLPSEKTKLTTSTNWDGVSWKTAAGGGQDLDTDSTGKIHFDGTYFYWVIDNNTPIRLTRA